MDVTASETPRTRFDATRIPVAREYNGPATEHTLNLGDARALGWIPDESVHLVVTSPPYFNLKEYNKHPGQLGEMDDYEAFHDALDGSLEALLSRAGARRTCASRFLPRQSAHELIECFHEAHTPQQLGFAL